MKSKISARLRSGFFILAALMMATSASASIVTGPLSDIFGMSLDSHIRFVPKGTPLANGGTTVIDIARSSYTTNGVLTQFLVGGLYNMYVDDSATPDVPIQIVVPTNDTNTYSLNYCISLATNLTKYGWVFLPSPGGGSPNAATTNGPNTFSSSNLFTGGVGIPSGLTADSAQLSRLQIVPSGNNAYSQFILTDSNSPASGNGGLFIFDSLPGGVSGYNTTFSGLPNGNLYVEGNLRGYSLVSDGGLTLNAANSILFGANSSLFSSTSGKLNLYNSAQNGFSQLYFGPPSGTWPSLVIGNTPGNITVVGGDGSTPANWIVTGTLAANNPNLTGSSPGFSVGSATTAGNTTNVNGQTIYTPEMFGAVGNRVVDDSVALQLAINAVEANGGYVQLAAKHYRITTNLVTTNYVCIRGMGVGLTSASYGFNGPITTTLYFPTNPPYLTGSVIVQDGTNQDGISCYNVASGLDLSDFGILFGTNVWFKRTGNGIGCYSQNLFPTNYDNGIQHSHWNNLYVMGAGSNSYCYFVRNGYYNKFDHLEGIGGGGFYYEANQQSPYGGVTSYLGNFTLSESDFVTLERGNAGGIFLMGTNGAQVDHVLLDRDQSSLLQVGGTPFGNSQFTFDQPLTFQYTNPQSTFYMNGAVQNITLQRGAYENLACGGPAIFQKGHGLEIFGTGLYEAGNILTNFTGFSRINGGNEFIRDYQEYGITLSCSGGKQELLFTDLGDSQFGGPYQSGMQFVNNMVDSYFAPGGSGNGWTWSTWDNTVTTQTIRAQMDYQGNFTNAGSVSSGLGFSNMLATSAASGSTGFYFGNPSQGYFKISTFDGFQNPELEMGYNGAPSVEIAQNAHNKFGFGQAGGGFRLGGSAGTTFSDNAGTVEIDGQGGSSVLTPVNIRLSTGNGELLYPSNTWSLNTITNGLLPGTIFVANSNGVSLWTGIMNAGPSVTFLQHLP